MTKLTKKDVWKVDAQYSAINIPMNDCDGYNVTPLKNLNDIELIPKSRVSEARNALIKDIATYFVLNGIPQYVERIVEDKIDEFLLGEQ